MSRARCGRCRHEVDAEGWRSLELVEILAPGAVRALVTSWPDDQRIEIRRCRACGAEIARKVAVTEHEPRE